VDDTAPEASSLAQGLRIVRLVVDREKTGKQLLGVSQLAAELGMDQSRVSRLTQELCELGLLERPERGPFRVGRGFFGLAATLNTGWIRHAGAELESLVAATGLRARVSVRDGYRVILLLPSSNDSRAGSFVQPGMVTPVWCTGSGRALLWDHKQRGFEALLSDVNFIGVGGPGAAHSIPEAWELMARDKAEGYVAAVEEFEHGIVEVAVPIRDPQGGIVASLSVLGSRAEMGSPARELADVLAAAAARLGAALPTPEG
jgi:DNA-binding IclR family transcriptional regulator